MLTENRAKKIEAAAKKRQEGIIVFEDIHDPHNAAAVLRTADAFGIQKVYFVFEKQERFNLKKVGKASSSSANKWLDFEVFSSSKECFKKLKKQGYTTIGTVLDSKAKSILKTNFKQPKIALVFGNEHAGLSQTAIDLCDAHVYVPMQGFVQSLNLSVTAAICMYEMFRQRKGDKKFLLPTKQQTAIIKAWSKK